MAQETRYCVIADFIHPHKDCTGEYMDDMTYDEAMKVYKEWQADKIHKNVTFEKSDLPFQGNGG